VTSYPSQAQLQEDQLTEASKILFVSLIAGCEQAFNAAIDQGKLSAHEAKSAFRHRLILEELSAIHENVTILTSKNQLDVKSILAFEETYRRLIGNRHKYITPPNFGRVKQIHINKLYVSPNFVTYSEKRVEQLELPLSTETQETRSNSYRKVLSGTFRAVLLGNPGAGKSTFAQKLCYDLVAHFDERILGGRRYITPIIVILRDYGPEKKNHNCSILEFIQARAKPTISFNPHLAHSNTYF
jgi:hypothetical protein